LAKFFKFLKILIGDERYALHREGVTDVKPVPRIPTRREGHIFTDNGDIIPATRGKYKPEAKRGETFRCGPSHIHPPTANGDNHEYHVLQEKETQPDSRNLLRLFRRKVREFNDSRMKRN